MERHKEHADKNYAVQIDVVGDHIRVGSLSHTFMAGLDFRTYDTEERKFESLLVDTIDITKPVFNKLPGEIGDFPMRDSEFIHTTSMGFSAQEVMEVDDRVRVMGGIRWGTTSSYTPNSSSIVRDTYLDPFVGASIRVWKDVHLFADYATTSDPMNAQYRNQNGEILGKEIFNQWETGLKTTWCNQRLRGDLTFYRIINNGINMQAAEPNPETGVVELKDYYFKGGEVKYEGIELDVIGYISDHLYASVGFSKMSAVYTKSTMFEVGSSPKNVPDYTVNAYINYDFESDTRAKGLSLGMGFYYVGKMYYNDWTNEYTEYHGIEPGLKPWMWNPYYSLNAQLNYDFRFTGNKNLEKLNVKLLLNNLTDKLGYTGYRLVNVNRTNPRHAAVEITYRF